MGIQLGSNFTVNTALPLDDRILVADITARNAILAGRRYEGMIVYVESDLTNYQLVGGILDANWTELSGSGGAGGINFITNGGAEETTPTDGWVRYALTEAVTFTDAGDLVTLTAHGLSTGSIVSFSVITSTTGIVINTSYFVIFSSANTFQLASTLANALSGTALALTTNGSGTMRRANPVTGTGGTPTNLLFGDSVSEGASVLAGTNSFNLSRAISTAAMGEGVSYDFTIDPVYKSRVLTIKFDYIWDSGGVAGTSSTDGSFTVWIYDVTNSVLIQPSSYKLFSNSTTTSDQFQAEFQTSNNSTSYRLIIHNAESTAAGLSFVFDNVSVSPNEYVFGTPISDWFDVGTITITGTTTNPTKGTVLQDKFRWRRVGKNMEFQYTYEQSTAGAAGSGDYLFTIPASIGQIDTSLVPLNTTIGTNSATDPSIIGVAGVGVPSVSAGPGYVSAYSATQFRIIGNSGATCQSVGSAFYTLSSTGTMYTAMGSVPMAGWSSSVQMADQTSTRIVDFSGYVSTNQALTANVTNLPVLAVKDTHAAWNGSLYTVPVPGDYQLNFVAFASTGAASMKVYRNGALYGVLQGVSTAGWTGGAVIVENCVVGDTLSVRGDGAITIVGGASTAGSKLSIARISGPSQIASSETVAAKYYMSADATYNGNIDYNTKDYDTHNAVTTGTNVWKFTAPISGVYEVLHTGRLTAGSGALFNLFKNGSSYQTISEANSSTVTTSGGTDVSLNAGEYIAIHTSANVTLDGGVAPMVTSISIKRAGNRG